MNAFTYFQSVYYRWQVRRLAVEDAYHQREATPAQAMAITLGGAPAGGATELAREVTTRDLSSQRSRVQVLSQRAASCWWWPAIPFLIPLLFFISWRADVRLFQLTGYPPVDAMLLGAMVSVLVLLAIWHLVNALNLPYDGTSRRTRRITIILAILFAIVASIVAIRLGQGDPRESWYVRAGSAGLIVAATLGPAAVLEKLLRKAIELAPILQERAALWREIRSDESRVRHEQSVRMRAARATDDWVHLTSKLEPYYVAEYEKAVVRLQREH